MTYQRRFDDLYCCVLIPTFNNATTLRRVLDQISSYTKNVVVVNDGSTDSTKAILTEYASFLTVNLPDNRGKGNALKEGFKVAAEAGYRYAISMDSDGQHYPDDLSVFLDALEQRNAEDPELLIIGSRKMDDPGVPERSSFGNRCSSFWYYVETGINLQDTQCGYRMYPLEVVNDLKLYTSRFELEIEVIVKAAWRGVEVINLPVKVFYDPMERVTHFRPFQDVARITLLNIWFVGVAFIYNHSRNLWQKFWNKKKSTAGGKSFSGTSLPLK